MMKTQIGLGVLSIPAVLDTLGMVPGIIVLILIAIITTWSDYMVGVFKLRHRSVYGIDDVGQLLFGRVGREIFGVVFVLCEYNLECRKSFALTLHSLDLRRRRWNAWNLDCSECSVHPRRLYCYLCRCCLPSWVWSWEHSDPRPRRLACMDRRVLYLDCK